MSRYRNCSELKEILKNKGAHLHLAGILGVSMSSLAELLCLGGYRVTGSDAAEGGARAHLESLGIPISHGNSAEHIDGARALVYSFAISESSAEMQYARGAGIPTFSRAELLGELMLEYKHRIGVSGSHGKSTTTAMLHRIFAYSSLTPTTLSGAALESGSALCIGSREYLIYEACEYRDAFLRFFPECAVITGIELDHTDYYPDLAALASSFVKSTKGATRVVLNADYPAARSIIPHISGGVVTYGAAKGAEYRYEIVKSGIDGSDFKVSVRGESLDFYLSIAGEHNVANATAAIAVALEYGIPYDAVCAALAGFNGIPRRLEHLFSVSGRAVLYDYAHHPTEIVATLRTVKELYGECTVVFRPHTYTRTRDLWGDMRDALALADFAVITDIYAAREAAIEGICAERLAAEIGNGAVYAPQNKVTEVVLAHTRGAIVLMGAGELENVKESLNSRRDI